MFCEKCGNALSDEANFCDSCGAPAKRQAAPASREENRGTEPHKQPISVGGWIGRLLISCIPIIGTLVYFILLFVWMGDKTKEETFTNWAKAQLWVLLIGIVISVVILVLFAFAAAMLGRSF